MQPSLHTKHYYTALSVAGLDPSGGAGLLADVKTFAALGVYGMAVATALTEQNTMGVRAVNSVSADIVYRQLVAVMSDIHTDAVKIGMVPDAATMRAIANAIKAYKPRHVVVDPVMVSSSGQRLMQPEALRAFADALLPLATIITPNIPEYEQLVAMGIDAESMVQNGTAVLLKGGHAEGEEKTDTLYYYNGKEVAKQAYSAHTVNSRNTHGTGCTLSSAIAAYLARGLQLPDAVGQAKVYLTQAIACGADVNIGHGAGALNHLFRPHPLIKR